MSSCDSLSQASCTCCHNSAIWTGSHCRPAGSWMDVSTDCCTMLGTVYRWCVAAFSSGLWNIPIPIDQVLDGYVIQMHIKMDALRKQWWPPEQHPGKKSIAPAVSPRISGNHLLAARLGSCLPLARLPLTSWHRQAWLLWCCEKVTGEWNGTLLSSDLFNDIHYSQDYQ